MNRFETTVAARVHDLPTLWDGLPVTWGEWHMESAFLCRPDDADDGTQPLREPPCPLCGSRDPRPVSIGTISRGRPRTRHGAPLIGVTRQITAERCTSCGHDRVQAGVQVWDLEADDYGDEGSYA